MKKIFLAAVSAAALISGAAQAQQVTTKSPFTITLSGDFRYAFGTHWDDSRTSAGRNTDGKFDSGMDARVTIEAKARHDSGFEYGFVGRLRNNQEGLSATGGAQDTVGMDRKYIFIEGKLGRVQLGDMAGAMTAVEVKAPDAGFIQSDSYYSGRQQLADMGLYDFFFFDEDTNGTKLTYLSPDIAGTGLKVGISYSPDQLESGRNLTRSNAAYDDMWELAAGYNRTFGGVELTLGGGFAWAAKTDRTLDQYRVWSLGGTVAVAGFTFGGSYYNNEGSYQARGTGVKIDHFDVGLTYAVNSAITVGTTYGENHYDRALTRNGRVVDANDHLWTVGGTYMVAPGLALQGDLGFFDAETARNGLGNNGTVAAMRARVQF